MQDLGLISGKHYDMGFSYGQMPQLETSASTSQSSNSAEYQDFEYYHPGANYYSDDTSSTQSSQPTGAQQYSSYYPYGPNFFTYRRDDYDDDFMPHRN